MLNKDWLKTSKRNLKLSCYHENMDKYVLFTYLSVLFLFAAFIFSIVLGLNIYGRIIIITSICLYFLIYPLILSYRKKAYNNYQEAYELTLELNDKILNKKIYKEAFIEKQINDLKYCISVISSKLSKNSIILGK